jgi:hypothetical protein
LINIKHAVAMILAGLGLGWLTVGAPGMIYDRVLDVAIGAMCRLAPAVCS